jgi:hypothetical protein
VGAERIPTSGWVIARYKPGAKAASLLEVIKPLSYVKMRQRRMIGMGVTLGTGKDLNS